MFPEGKTGVDSQHYVNDQWDKVVKVEFFEYLELWGATSYKGICWIAYSVELQSVTNNQLKVFNKAIKFICSSWAVQMDPVDWSEN